MRIGLVVIFLVFAISVGAQDSQIESVSIPTNVSDSTLKITHNPFLVAGASLLVPGAGQFSTRHYIKGGTFLAFEALTASLAVYWLNDEVLKKSERNTLKNEIKGSFGIDSIKGHYDLDLAKHDELFSRCRAYNSVAWATGIYVYNFLDAIECSNIINKTGPRSPMAAGWLSAIPVLGLGQWYNGSVSKAGMMFMGQVGLGVVALNYHRLMKDAERKIKILDKIDENDTLAYSVKEDYLAEWESQQHNAFKSRNTYLWYSIFFYLYGIVDAVVDAHLHDYSDKMRMYPDLVPQSDGAQLRLNVKF